MFFNLHIITQKNIAFSCTTSMGGYDGMNHPIPMFRDTTDRGNNRPKASFSVRPSGSGGASIR